MINDIEDADATLPKQAINKIGKLFKVEHEIEGKSAEEKEEIRQSKSKPILDDFFSWCKEKQYLSTSKKLSTAFTYVLNHEEGLRQYINDGYIPMTNSLDERTIRPFAIGRKNGLFSTSVSGAESSACAYSVIETAKANGIDPYKYLVELFTYLPNKNMLNNKETLDNFFPCSEFVQENCK